MSLQHILFTIIVILVSSCSQTYQDKSTKADLTAKAKTELAFVGVRFTVKDGVVTLSGKCPTEQVKTQVEKKAAEIAGVKQVVNQISIAPVMITADHPLQQKVDSLLLEYPQAQAIVTDSVITLQGQVASKDLEKLLNGLKHLKARQVQNDLSLQRGS